MHLCPQQQGSLREVCVKGFYCKDRSSSCVRLRLSGISNDSCRGRLQCRDPWPNSTEWTSNWQNPYHKDLVRLSLVNSYAMHSLLHFVAKEHRFGLVINCAHFRGPFEAPGPLTATEPWTSTPQCTSTKGLIVSLRWYLGYLKG